MGRLTGIAAGSAPVLEPENGGWEFVRPLSLGGMCARLAGLVLVAVVVGGGLSAAAARADTADLAVAYQINVAHSGVQSDSTLTPPFSRRWHVTLPGAISYPLIAQGMVYVTSGDNNTP